MAILIVVIIALAVIGGIGVGLYVYMRRIFQDQKNYERGLKMVPLLIHLPPPSDDVEASGRDVRDAVNENISRAQVLYNILASTYKKESRFSFYGQRHIAFEVIASQGVVHFYAAVPISLLGVVEQAVVSAYPAAKLEEVPEHNIFNPLGRLSGTAGGELVLKEKFAYPIATYEDIKRDTMQSILNALSTLQKEDGAAIQILLRPADSSWRKAAVGEAEKKRKGKTKKGGIESSFWWLGQIFTALTKPPETKGDKPEEAREVSSLDQSVIQSIEEKTKQPGYEVVIRLVASSDVPQRAQTVLNNLVATFALFDAPGKNGFKFIAAKDPANFISAFILRLFPQASTTSILNSTELSTLFHFPDQNNIPTTQLERQASKQVDGPRDIPQDGMLLGYNMFRGNKKAIKLDEADRRRHLYAVGQTGTGKSVFMENLALQDMLDGRGFAFVDPHGDAVDRLLSMVPKERAEDVIYFNPADIANPLGLNMFEYQSPDQKDFIIQETINMLYKLYDPQRQGIIGPRYEHIFRNCALAIMADPAGGTFIDIPKLLRDPQFLRDKLKHVTDQNVLDFWLKEYPASQRSQEAGDIISWFISKFGAFLSNEMMRNIVGQNKSAFNLREVMDDGKILLINLSRGKVGELNSKLLGMIFVMKFQAAAMSRSDIEEKDRRDFCLYVDEFQNFSTDSFADILSEARKYKLNLIVANQFTTQLSDEIREAVIGNVGSIVSFRVGTSDAELLAKQFAPLFDIDDLQFLPNYNAVVKMLIHGVPTQPFSMATIPPLGTPNPQLAVALRQLSAAKFGRPRTVVEDEIFKRMATSAPTAPAGLLAPRGSSPDGFGGEGSALTAVSPAKPRTTGSSFLDDWLKKRRLPPAKPPIAAAPVAGRANPATPGPEPVSGGPSEGHVDLRAASSASVAAQPAGHTFKIDNS